jgi:hypothetical protein
VSARLLIILLCAVNLTAGGAAGVWLDRTALAEKRPQRSWDRGDPSRVIDKRLEDLTARLELDAEQAKKIREILVARQPAIQAAFKDLRPKLDAIRAESDDAIKAVLRPEQRTRYADYVAEMAASRHGRRGGLAPAAAIGSDTKEAPK